MQFLNIGVLPVTIAVTDIVADSTIVGVMTIIIIVITVVITAIIVAFLIPMVIVGNMSMRSRLRAVIPCLLNAIDYSAPK